SRGGISKEQMIAVQEKFQGGAAESLRVVVAHHPFWLPEQSEYRDLVTNRDAALEAFRAADVDLILSGHVHLPYTQLVQDVLIVHAGTTFSNRLSQNQPNSFNVLRGDQAQLSVDFMNWNGQSFQLAEQREFQKQAGVWKQTAGLNSV
ncbi:MAG TPA: metallophosphoesterase, partial [Thiolinea sp.]|nr:metallophosphoesterase [Thiolinea sp.]